MQVIAIYPLPKKIINMGIIEMAVTLTTTMLANVYNFYFSHTSWHLDLSLNSTKLALPPPHFIYPIWSYLQSMCDLGFS